MKKVLTLCLVMFILVTLVSCGEKVEWPNSKLGNMIPHIENAKGEIGYENSSSLYIILRDINEKQYDDYIKACKDKGFSIDVKETSGSYVAHNKDGYKIDISYFSSEKDMWITISVPIAMSTFSWPNSEIAKLLPKPKSNYGKIEWETNYGFVIYVGNTTKSEYNIYVNEVYANGFTVGYNKGDDYFYAKNQAGYSVSIKYEGSSVMFIRIDEPKKEENTTAKTNGESLTVPHTSSNPNLNSPTITKDNNQEFAALLLLIDPADPSVASFASRYSGQTIEFDGCILSMMNHGSYKTRYDILIGAGDYNKNTCRGPNFHLSDVNASDMKLGTLFPEDVISNGTNIHVVAKVGKYIASSQLFELDIISVTVR